MLLLLLLLLLLLFPLLDWLSCRTVYEHLHRLGLEKYAPVLEFNGIATAEAMIDTGLPDMLKLSVELQYDAAAQVGLHTDIYIHIHAHIHAHTTHKRIDTHMHTHTRACTHMHTQHTHTHTHAHISTS